jgi:hypothetical protein
MTEELTMRQLSSPRATRVIASLAAGLCLSQASPLGAQDVALPDVSLAELSTAVELPMPKLGETREFIGAVASVNCDHWEVVNLDLNGHMVSQCGQNKIYFKKDDSLNLHKVTAANDKTTLVFEPSYPGVEFPLQVGKKWRRQYTGYAAVEGLRWDGDIACEVADYTDVVVAAGTFKAYRIECHDDWAVGTMESSVNSTTWYAPDVPGIVKTINYEDPRWNSELKAYSR